MKTLPIDINKLPLPVREYASRLTQYSDVVQELSLCLNDDANYPVAHDRWEFIGIKFKPNAELERIVSCAVDLRADEHFVQDGVHFFWFD